MPYTFPVSLAPVSSAFNHSHGGLPWRFLAISTRNVVLVTISATRNATPNTPQISGARRRWLVPGLEVGLYLGCYLVYWITRGLLFDESTALLNAERVISIERSLGIFGEPAWQSWLVDQGPGLLIFFNWVYIITYWPIILGMGLVLYLHRRTKYYYYRNVLVLNLLLALTFFLLLPVAPPFKSVPGLLDSIQTYGPTFYGSPQMTAFYNTNAAVPSLHFSWTAIFGVLFYRSMTGWRKYLGILYPVLTLSAIVITGNHFVLDAAVGGTLVALSFGLVVWAQRRGFRLPQELTVRSR